MGPRPPQPEPGSDNRTRTRDASGSGLIRTGEHRDDIQGLRAVAVLLVVLSHAGVRFLKGGYVGVDVFFVLSGFLITGLLLTGVARRGRSSLGDFYVRRARRILPAATLTLVATDVVVYRLLNFVRAKQALQDSIWASIFTSNIHFANQGTDYFARAQPPSPIQQFWSLSVEEQFYLVWPAVLSIVVLGVVLRRRSRNSNRLRSAPAVTTASLHRLLVVVLGISAASLAWSVYDTHAHATEAYFSTFARVWELGLGGALAIASASVARVRGSVRAVFGWVGLIFICAAAVLYTTGTAFPGYAALLPTIGAAFVIGAGVGTQPRFGSGRLLAIAPLRYVGDRSYAFYLWHWPVLIIALEYHGHALSVTTNLLLLVGAFALSIVSFKVVENPIRRMRWRSPAYGLALWPASVLAVMIVAGSEISAVDARATRLAEVGAPLYPGLGSNPLQPVAGSAPNAKELAAEFSPPSSNGVLPAVVAAVRAVQQGSKIPAGLQPPIGGLLSDHYLPPAGCSANQGETTSSICSLGALMAKRSIVVMGDSHAMMWIPTISSIAGQDHWIVRPITKSACTPADWFLPQFHSNECTAWLAWAVRQIQALRPDVTLINGDFADLAGQDQATTAGVASLVGRLTSSSKRVVVLGDQPKQNQQPVDCLLAASATMAHCSMTPTAEQLAVASDVSSGAASGGGRYIDTSGWFCYDNYCPMVVGNTIVYSDTNHITTTYALDLRAPFLVAFRKAVVGPRSGQV